MASSYSTPSPFSTLDHDIIRTHIMTRLDGPSLAALSCTSSRFLALSSDEELWREICSSTWSSTNDRRVRQVISTFTGGHRSFFSDAFPLLDHKSQSSIYSPDSTPGPSHLISAVDIRYRNESVFSEVRETNTRSFEFLFARFKIELLDQSDAVSTPIRQLWEIDSALVQDLRDNLSLSWVLIDPMAKRAANLSSGRAVMVEYPCSGWEIQLRYSTIMTANGWPGLEETEYVECRMMVTCSGVEGGELRVDEVSLEVKDIQGRGFGGKESLVILQDALVNGKRKPCGRGEHEDRYCKFEKVKNEANAKKVTRGDRLISMICYPIVGVVTFGFTVFWFGVLLIATEIRSKIRRN